MKKKIYPILLILCLTVFAVSGCKDEEQSEAQPAIELAPQESQTPAPAQTQTQAAQAPAQSTDEYYGAVDDSGVPDETALFEAMEQAEQ